MRLDVQPGSKLWIEGGSNLSGWSCMAETFEASVDIGSALVLRDDIPTLTQIIQQVRLRVAVRVFKCGNSVMEDNLYAALGAGDPFRSSDILASFNALPGASTEDLTLHTEGTIIVAGVAKAVRLTIAMERLAGGLLKARGSVPLLMSDFGVTPPTGLFGLVRSRNEVVVKFDLVIGAHAELLNLGEAWRTS